MNVGASTNRPALVLADDNRSFVVACRHLLEAEFDIVAAVHSGREAIRAVERYDPDILVLDISMPGMSGVEVIETLAGRGCRTRIVVLTLHRDGVIADRVADLGAIGYVLKSRMARDLPAAVRAAINGEPFRSPP